MTICKIVTDPFGDQRKYEDFCQIAKVSSSLKVGFGFVCIAQEQCTEIEQKSQ